MHTIEIPKLKRTIEFPSEVSELNSEQFVYFAGLVTKFNNKKIDFDTFKYLLVRNLLNLADNLNFNSHYNAVLITELMDSFFTITEKDGVKNIIIDLHFVDNKILSFKKGKTLYIGPKDALQNITFAEYIDAYGYFLEYSKSKNIKALDKLIATLWRKHIFDSPDFSEDTREPYNKKLVGKHAWDLKHLSFDKKYAAYLFFSACQQYITSAKIEIEGVEIDLSIIFKSDSNEPSKSNIGLVGVLFKMAESSVFGDIEKTGKQNLWDVLIRMYQVTAEAKEKLEQLKANNAKTN